MAQPLPTKEVTHTRVRMHTHIETIHKHSRKLTCMLTHAHTERGTLVATLGCEHVSINLYVLCPILEGDKEAEPL